MNLHGYSRALHFLSKHSCEWFTYKLVCMLFDEWDEMMARPHTVCVCVCLMHLLDRKSEWAVCLSASCSPSVSLSRLHCVGENVTERTMSRSHLCRCCALFRFIYILLLTTRLLFFPKPARELSHTLTPDHWKVLRAVPVKSGMICVLNSSSIYRSPWELRPLRPPHMYE